MSLRPNKAHFCWAQTAHYSPFCRFELKPTTGPILQTSKSGPMEAISGSPSQLDQAGQPIQAQTNPVLRILSLAWFTAQLPQVLSPSRPSRHPTPGLSLALSCAKLLQLLMPTSLASQPQRTRPAHVALSRGQERHHSCPSFLLSKASCTTRTRASSRLAHLPATQRMCLDDFLLGSLPTCRRPATSHPRHPHALASLAHVVRLDSTSPPIPH